jgi:hypothetical protein
LSSWVCKNHFHCSLSLDLFLDLFLGPLVWIRSGGDPESPSPLPTLSLNSTAMNKALYCRCKLPNSFCLFPSSSHWWWRSPVASTKSGIVVLSDSLRLCTLSRPVNVASNGFFFDVCPSRSAALRSPPSHHLPKAQMSFKRGISVRPQSMLRIHLLRACGGISGVSAWPLFIHDQYPQPWDQQLDSCPCLSSANFSESQSRSSRWNSGCIAIRLLC